MHLEVEDKYDKYVEEKGSEKQIHPEYVAFLVDKLADEDAIFTVDTGMSAVWAARYLKVRSKSLPDRVIQSWVHGECYANGHRCGIILP